MKNDGKKKPTPAAGSNGAAGGGAVGGAGGGGANKPRRLGRGLSSLIGSPVVVSPTPKVSPAAPAPKPAAMPAPIAAGEVETKPLAPSLNGHTRHTPAHAHQHEDAAEPASTFEPAKPPVPEPEPAGERLIEVELSQLVPSKYQPRKKFDEAALAELAASIKSAGVVQPIVVRPISDAAAGRSIVTGVASTGEAKYEIIAGERRWRASQLAGLTHVPARVCQVGEEQAAEWALIENLQRSDLGAMERAWALRGLCEKFGLTHAQAGEKVGLDRSSVTNLVRLTELESEISIYLEEAQLSLGHGKALLGMTPGPARVSLARKAAEEAWSVRRLESEAAKRSQAIKAGAASIDASGGPDQDPRRASLLELEQQLSSHLGTRARLKTSRDGSKGRLILEFYDLDHFDGLMNKMGFVLSS